ncbi:hypothetical protein BN1048_01579 [Jeotgalicoccus saudimassiliensis]|uniref:Uncharacterized protein n=1 Tax=Jeotgalicoccus saudimassiliensis TaxID=1461582 RepID=A0A078M703_9STAP|nr:DUF6583 family protein [Jeotgalicoccus saudimassiliensis]CEA02040.1 hypothetical protein BN1048_01579 [Jeotgalicoccus saudimassiliensis]
MGKKGLTILGVSVGVIAVLAIGAYILFQTMVNNPKNNYLLAELDSVEDSFGLFEERFESELDWYEHAQENAIQSTVDITAETNDPSFQEMGMTDMINNSNIKLDVGQDVANEVSTLGLNADVAGFSISDVHAYITGEKAGVTLPFVEEYMVVNEEDAASFLHKLDPETFTGEEDIDYSVFFESSAMTETQREYFKDEYSSFIRENLPDEAFESESEEITVGDNTVNADKLTMTLTEEQIHTFLRDLFNKMAEDEELANIIETQMMAANVGNPEAPTGEEAATEFNDSLKEAAENVEDLGFPDGLTSIIWTDGDDNIIQRDMDTALTIDDSTGQIAVDGTTEVKENSRVTNYDIAVSDDSMETVFGYTADLNETETGYEDTITLRADADDISGDLVIINSVKSEEEDNEIWNADISFNEELFGSPLTLYVESNSVYNDDQATGDMTFYAEDGMNVTKDTFVLNLASDSETVSEIELPGEDNEKNIGQMSEDELNSYFNDEVGPQFEEWVTENFGAPSGF